ncbi:MAG: DUF2905 family protein [Thermoanaerobaculum sp.]
MGALARLLIITGAVLASLGVVLLLLSQTGWRVPGDLVFRGRNWTVYLPLGTSLLLSALLTLILWLVSRR